MPRGREGRRHYHSAVTHLYTLLIGGLVIPGGDEPDGTAVAWAADTVLAIGDDDEIRAISRGDSHLVDLKGAVVVPLGAAGDATWPVEVTLTIGSRADLAVLSGDPRLAPVRTLALVRGGSVVSGALPGALPHGDHEH